MLSVIMLSVIMPSVIMLSVILLNVVAAIEETGYKSFISVFNFVS